jgi:hypothetical protein
MTLMEFLADHRTVRLTKFFLAVTFIGESEVSVTRVEGRGDVRDHHEIKIIITGVSPSRRVDGIWRTRLWERMS